MPMDYEDKTEIARILTRKCINCYEELPGYNVHGSGWNWLTLNVGPFCNDCWEEVKTMTCHCENCNANGGPHV